MYKWDWGWVWTYREGLIEATALTLWFNAAILVLGSITGLLIALARRSRFKPVRVTALVYIDIFRALPLLVLLVWAFFCIPILFWGVQLLPTTSAVIVLSLNLSAFIAEIIRSGIESIPEFHIESAKTLGFSRFQTLRFVTLPIGLRNMVPALVGQYINTIKLSVLASVIAVPELLHQTNVIIAQTYRPLEFYTILALIFLILLLPLTIWSRRLESGAVVQRKINSEK
jgi:polar amino acid transport system permease protein